MRGIQVNNFIQNHISFNGKKITNQINPVIQTHRPQPLVIKHGKDCQSPEPMLLSDNKSPKYHQKKKKRAITGGVQKEKTPDLLKQKLQQKESKDKKVMRSLSKKKISLSLQKTNRKNILHSDQESDQNHQHNHQPVSEQDDTLPFAQMSSHRKMKPKLSQNGKNLGRSKSTIIKPLHNGQNINSFQKRKQKDIKLKKSQSKPYRKKSDKKPPVTGRTKKNKSISQVHIGLYSEPQSNQKTQKYTTQKKKINSTQKKTAPNNQASNSKPQSARNVRNIHPWKKKLFDDKIVNLQGTYRNNDKKGFRIESKEQVKIVSSKSKSRSKSKSKKNRILYQQHVSEDLKSRNLYLDHFYQEKYKDNDIKNMMKEFQTILTTVGNKKQLKKQLENLKKKLKALSQRDQNQIAVGGQSEELYRQFKPQYQEKPIYLQQQVRQQQSSEQDSQDRKQYEKAYQKQIQQQINDYRASIWQHQEQPVPSFQSSGQNNKSQQSSGKTQKIDLDNYTENQSNFIQLNQNDKLNDHDLKEIKSTYNQLLQARNKNQQKFAQQQKQQQQIWQQKDTNHIISNEESNHDSNPLIGRRQINNGVLMDPNLYDSMKSYNVDEYTDKQLAAQKSQNQQKAKAQQQIKEEKLLSEKQQYQAQKQRRNKMKQIQSLKKFREQSNYLMKKVEENEQKKKAKIQQEQRVNKNKLSSPKNYPADDKYPKQFAQTLKSPKFTTIMELNNILSAKQQYVNDKHDKMTELVDKMYERNLVSPKSYEFQLIALKRKQQQDVKILQNYRLHAKQISSMIGDIKRDKDEIEDIDELLRLQRWQQALDLMKKYKKQDNIEKEQKNKAQTITDQKNENQIIYNYMPSDEASETQNQQEQSQFLGQNNYGEKLINLHRMDQEARKQLQKQQQQQQQHQSNDFPQMPETVNSDIVIKIDETDTKALKKMQRGFQTNLYFIKQYCIALCEYIKENTSYLDHFKASMIQPLAYPMKQFLLGYRTTITNQIILDPISQYSSLKFDLLYPYILKESKQKPINYSIFEQFNKGYDKLKVNKYEQCSELDKRLEVIFLKSIYDCIAQSLNFQRPGGLNGKPLPWMSDSKHLKNKKYQKSLKKYSMKASQQSDLQSIDLIFGVAIARIIQWGSCLCGFIPDTVDFENTEIDEQYVNHLRQTRMALLLEKMLMQQQSKMNCSQVQQTQVLLSLGAKIFDHLLDEMEKELKVIQLRSTIRAVDY